MLKSFNKNISKILLAALLIACIGLLVHRNAYRFSKGARPKSLALSVWLPVQKFMNKVIAFPENTLNAIRELRYLREEVNRLQLENQEYRMALSNYKSLENQLKRLESVLQLRSKFPRNARISRIIAHDPSTWNKSFVIDAGSDDGVSVDSPVLSEQGIVGRVLHVTPSYSRVLLITDASSSVAGIVMRSRVTGIVQGMGHSDLKYAYVDVREDVQKDDLIVSSGLGGIFPRGYVIGTITKHTTSENTLNADIEVVPAVDFGSLDYVFVLPPVDVYR